MPCCPPAAWPGACKRDRSSSVSQRAASSHCPSPQPPTRTLPRLGWEPSPRRRRGEGADLIATMTAARRVALALACFTMLVLVCPFVCPPAQAQTKTRVAGRSLVEVLREFQAQGVRLIFSSDLVSANL